MAYFSLYIKDDMCADCYLLVSSSACISVDSIM